jgi:hypothetical protein
VVLEGGSGCATAEGEEEIINIVVVVIIIISVIA